MLTPDAVIHLKTGRDARLRPLLRRGPRLSLHYGFLLLMMGKIAFITELGGLFEVPL